MNGGADPMALQLPPDRPEAPAIPPRPETLLRLARTLLRRLKSDPPWKDPAVSSDGRAGLARETLRALIDTDVPTLEIGPFGKPFLLGPNIKYFDVLGTVDLKARAEKVGDDHVDIPDIHFVDPNGDLTIVDECFSIALSSHCIEHQPDLVAHLRGVHRLLVPGGVYVLLIPDRRFCFDHFIADSTIADVLDAHYSGRKVHNLRSIIEHRALTCHNDGLRHWNGESGPHEVTVDRINYALDEWRAAQGGYVDVHAWQFTPSSFEPLIRLLKDLGLIALDVHRVYGTPFGRHEFIAILRKPD